MLYFLVQLFFKGVVLSCTNVLQGCCVFLSLCFIRLFYFFVLLFYKGVVCSSQYVLQRVLYFSLSLCYTKVLCYYVSLLKT
jgi:hypothetical protein